MLNLTETFWIILISALLGAIIQNLHKIIISLYNRLKKTELVNKEGWHSYHSTFEKNNPIIEEGKIFIKRGFLKKFKVTEKINSNLYKGDLYKEEGHLVINLKCASDKKETVFMRIFYPTKQNDNHIGFWLSFDHSQKNICSGLSILTKDKYENKEKVVKDLIKRRVQIEPDYSIMRIIWEEKSVAKLIRRRFMK